MGRYEDGRGSSESESESEWAVVRCCLRTGSIVCGQRQLDRDAELVQLARRWLIAPPS